MKIVSTLLLALLLFLIGQPPCMAVEEINSNCCAEKSCTADSPAEEKSGDQDCHGCNPFQACSCCAAAVILPVAVPITIYPVSALPATPVWGLCATDCLRSRSADFWQPPRQS